MIFHHRKIIILILIFLSAVNLGIVVGINSNLVVSNNFKTKNPVQHFDTLDSTNPIKDSFKVGPSLEKIFFNPDNNYIYALSSSEESVFVINSGATVIGNTIPIGTVSSQIVYDHQNRCLYASNDYGGTIPIINTTTNSLIGTLSTGNYTKDKGLFFNTYNQLLYVESFLNNNLLAVNVTTQKIVSTIPITTQFSSSGSISMDLHHNLYIPSSNNIITIVNSDNSSIIKSLTVNGTVLTTVYDTWTGFIYITDSSNTITVYDPISEQIISRISVGSSPVDIIYDQTDDAIFEINNNTGTLDMINGTTNTLVGKVMIGSDPIALTYDSNNSAIYIVQNQLDSVVQVDIPSFISLINALPQNNNGITIIITIALLIGVIIVIAAGYAFLNKNEMNKNVPDVSLSSVDELFQKKIIMQYLYGRLTAFFNKISKLPKEMIEKTFLITDSDIKSESEIFVPNNLRLGEHGQNLIKEMNGLSLMVLLEFADSYPKTVTITTISKVLHKPKSTIKSQIDKLINLEYVKAPGLVLTDPNYLDRRYKILRLTKNGKEFLQSLKLEIEVSGILNKPIAD